MASAGTQHTHQLAARATPHHLSGRRGTPAFSTGRQGYIDPKRWKTPVFSIEDNEWQKTKKLTYAIKNWPRTFLVSKAEA